MSGFKKKQMDRREGSLLHFLSVGCLEDARACLYCLFLTHMHISALSKNEHLFVNRKCVGVSGGIQKNIFENLTCK